MNVTANKPAQQGKKRSNTTMEEFKPDSSRVVEMLEKLMQQQEANNIQQKDNKEEILGYLKSLETRMDGADNKQEKIVQQQAKDKEDILQDMQTYEKQNAQRFDRVEKHLDSTKEQLQKQGQQCTAMAATLQQSLTAQNAQILQIQSGCAKTTQRVQLMDKKQEQARKETKNNRETMTTLEAGVKEMRHEQGKMRDNESARIEIHRQQMFSLRKKWRGCARHKSHKTKPLMRWRQSSAKPIMRWRQSSGTKPRSCSIMN
jgi:hypothetical protein